MMEKNDILNLKKRYLIWLYKEAKEALDKVDRKFTQLEIDKFILEELRVPLIITHLSLPRRRESSNFHRLGIPAFGGMTFLEEPLNKRKIADKKFLDEFNTYVTNKDQGCQKIKSGEEYLNSEHQFLFLKLKAIEKAILKELGAEGLEEIKNLYQNEMVDRILRSTEH